MIGLIQRVTSAKVVVGGEPVGQIQGGILLLLGVEKDDSSSQIEKLARKIRNLRIFADEDGKMNLSLKDTQGKLLVVSQFTLVADTAKGNRPGFSNSAPPELGEKLYNEFIEHYSTTYDHCEAGTFGANMQVELVNDGPATFHIKV
jgi:D-tyrosyl-tRNA(Tyr) deacylase